MTDFFEAATRDGVFRFDGQILEIFAMDGSQRFHPRLLPELWIDGEFLYVRRRDVTTMPWIFDEAQRGQLEVLVSSVAAVRGT
jgi:hypothetical protein